MAITLGSNIASLKAQRQLFNTDRTLSTVFERLSSGQRINRASDDAAGLAISESLRVDNRVYSQGIRNINDGISALNIADSTVNELSKVVTRIQELAQQASNGALSNEQRGSLDLEAQALRDEFFRVSRSADFNGLRLFDGSIEDGLRLQGGYGVDGSIFSSLGGEMGDGTFSLGEVLGTTDALDLTNGDINNDGNLDLIANIGTATEIYLGDGAGGFSLSDSISIDPDPRILELIDLNNDGNLDFFAGGTGIDFFATYLNNGDGTFTRSQTIDFADTNTSTSADFNGDGNIDIALNNPGGDTAAFLLGNGDGTFTASSVTINTPEDPQDLVAADVNGDGVADLVVAGYSLSEFVSYIGNGDGTFQAGLTINTASAPQSIASFDINNDGLDDIITSNSADDNIAVFLSSGSGFSESAAFASNSTLTVDFGDFNGDGRVDIVSKGFNTSVFLQDSSGGFDEEISTPDSGVGFSLTVGDINNDGVTDIISGESGYTALLGNTREGIAPILEFSLETLADARQAIAPLERKLQSLSEQRGVIGAFQSRLESALSTLGSTSENYASAESRIRDADIAYESSRLTRLTILQQASAAVLSQANVQPALALSLLEG